MCQLLVNLTGKTGYKTFVININTLLTRDTGILPSVKVDIFMYYNENALTFHLCDRCSDRVDALHE